MLRIYDTLEGGKKEFVPVEDGKVGMYFCGLTVQSEPHVGHMRVAVVADVFRRYLRFLGYDVTLVINFTDIDDKIIEKAREEGVDYTVIAERNIDKFMEFLRFLGAEEADHYPRATGHIDEIIALVQRGVRVGRIRLLRGGEVADLRQAVQEEAR
jgi:cysteinyl-tRNA synthetase